MDDRTLDQLLTWVDSHYFGKYRGVVSSNEDPAKRGRLLVKVPAVLGDLAVWAMPCVPYAGNKVGAYFIPDKDTGVWVEFEAGDPSFPIWSGCFWGDDQTPGAAEPKVKVLRTAAGWLQIDDDKREVVLERQDGAKLTSTDTLVAEAGESSLSLEGSAASLTQGAAGVEVSGGATSLNGGALKVQ